MRAHNPGCGAEILRVIVGGCSSGDFCDGDGGRVGGKDGMGGGDGGELFEDGEFEGGNLGHGFDDEVGSGEGGEGCGGLEEGEGFAGEGGVDALFRDVFLEEGVCEFHGLVQGGLRGVDEGDWDLDFLGCDEGDAETLIS